MHKSLLCAAMAGVVYAGHAQANDAASAPAREKCYGIAKAGKNDCASADGAHGCMGMAKKDNALPEWKFVNKGQCAGLGGNVTPPKK